MNNFDWIERHFAMQNSFAKMAEKVNAPLNFYNFASQWKHLAEQANTIPNTAYNPFAGSMDVSKLIGAINRKDTLPNIVDIFSGQIGRKFITPPKGFDDGTLAVLSGMSGVLAKHATLYEQQQSLAEKAYSALKGAMVATDVLSAFSKTTINEKISASTLFSGTTFLNTLSDFGENEEEMREAYDEASRALDNDDIQREVSGFQDAVLRDSGVAENDVSAWVELPDVKKGFEKILNILIQRYGVNPRVAKIIVLLALMVVLYAGECVVEGTGSGVYNAVVGHTEMPVEKDTVFVEKELPKAEKHFTIGKAIIYEDHSIHSKELGQLIEGAEVEIKDIIDGWCLVEGTIGIAKKKTRKNKQKVTGSVKKLTGWIEKNILQMFQ